jgi:membrane associated rhomboid family serine protease
MRAGPVEPAAPVSTLKWLLIVLVAVFVLQNILRHWFGLVWMENLFALGPGQLARGYLHTLLSYGFLHSTDGGVPWHLLVNALMLYWFGRGIETRIGTDRFLELFLIAVLAGGLMWSLVRLGGAPGAMVVGASAGVFGIMTLFCLFNWRQDMTFVLIPLRFEGRHLFYILGGFQAFFFLFQELPALGYSSTAYSAHLGGMLGGWVFYQHLLPRVPFWRWRWRAAAGRATAAEIRPPEWEKKAAAVKAQTAGRFTVNLGNREEVRREVDRILDKINTKGFGALSREEKDTLDKAREMLR